MYFIMQNSSSLKEAFDLTKKLNPSRFGNKNYKLIVLLRWTVMQDRTAIVHFTLHLAN